MAPAPADPAHAAWPAVAVLCVAVLWQAFMQRHHLGDDAYITLTYAKNLAAGNGFVFNAGEPTLGTTTPLLTVVVAALSLVLPFVPIPTIAVLVGGASTAGVAVLLYVRRETWKLGPWAAAFVGLVVIANVHIQLLGMESALFAFLLTVSLTLTLEERWRLAGVAVGLLFLTRGEGLLVLGIVGIVAWVRADSFRDAIGPGLQAALGFAIPVAAWGVFALVSIGTVLPSTLDAKQAQAASGDFATFPTRLFRDWLPGFGSDLAFGPVHVWRLLAAIGLVDAIVRHRDRLVLVGWVLLYVVGYTIVGVAGYGWYQETIFFVGNLLFAFGGVAAVDWLRTRLPGQPRVADLAAASGVALVVLALLAPSLGTSTNLQGNSREPVYRALTTFLDQDASPGDRVAHLEVGYLGYFTSLEVVDLVGLVSPGAIPYVAEGDYTTWFWLERPEYLVQHPSFQSRIASILTDPCFTSEYEPVWSTPTPDSRDLVVHRRVADTGCTPLAN